MIKMGWQNPYALGNEALGNYNPGSHGSASATYESMTNADLPSYAHGFYSQTEHEALSEIKYSRTEIGYDNNLREIKRALDGAPLEAYTPHSHFVDDSGSAIPKTGEVIEPIIIKRPDKKIVDEILKAQREVTGKEIILKETEIDEIVIKRKRVKKREIRLEDKKRG
jgi:lauroyl/myristoyl acyltransferase